LIRAIASSTVLAGQIQRGDGETIHAVIWYSDLRGSTPMADTLPRDDYIRTLNDYFECAGGAVLAQGGEILAFIRDAVLAIFPVDEHSEATTRACLQLTLQLGDRPGDLGRAAVLDRAAVVGDARDRAVPLRLQRSETSLQFSSCSHGGISWIRLGQASALPELGGWRRRYPRPTAADPRAWGQGSVQAV
jgi:class 3 adenylate cyclase